LCAREAIGADAELLFVDANGAYSRKQALELAGHFRAEAKESWLEEPVPSGRQRTCPICARTAGQPRPTSSRASARV